MYGMKAEQKSAENISLHSNNELNFIASKWMSLSCSTSLGTAWLTFGTMTNFAQGDQTKYADKK